LRKVVAGRYVALACCLHSKPRIPAPMSSGNKKEGYSTTPLVIESTTKHVGDKV